MPLYRIKYNSMTATYGPAYIEAEDEWAARKKFAGTTLAVQLVSAKQISADQMAREIRRSVENENL